MARVASVELTDAWSKAGVMIRAGLNGGDAHAFMFASAAFGRGSARRLYTNAATVYAPGCLCSAPGWVLLVRAGDLFAAFDSSDGTDWRLVSVDQIAMPPTVYVGLAVTSRNPAATSLATFTDVAVGTITNRAPSVSIQQPATGTHFSAPATITVSADAADEDGSIARVDFYQGGSIPLLSRPATPSR